MSFGFDDAVDAIGEDSRRLSDAVARADLDARVPSCPEWSVRDLAHHIGVVQWYWAVNVRAANAAERAGAELTPVPGDGDLLAWLGWCTYSLLGALRDAGPDGPCWTWWGEPRSAAAVGRHQAQEVAVHRWDAELSTGSVGSIRPELASDGVPDFIEIMVGGDVSALSGNLILSATDTGASWQVQGSSSGAAGERSAELRATASDLVLMLYRRLPVPDEAVVGDPFLVAAFLSLADTR